ncbi:MAG: ParA family protein [Candidatus Promineifilaceae bacterium]
MTNLSGKIIAVANRKGGVGKTTTTITLAQGLARKVQADRGRVLIIDFDPQGNVATSLAIEPREQDLADLLLDKCSFKECIISADRTADGLARPNLFVVPSSDSLAEAKGELMIKSAIGGRRATPIEDILHSKLGFVRDLFAYTIIDCPPTLDVFSDAVYQLADEAIVPVKTDFLGEVGTARHTNDILEAQAYGIKIKIACILPTFYDKRLTIARSVHKTLIKHYGSSIVFDPIPRSTAFEQAPAVNGQTILEYRPDSPSARAYQKLIDRIHAS